VGVAPPVSAVGGTHLAKVNIKRKKAIGNTKLTKNKPKKSGAIVALVAMENNSASLYRNSLKTFKEIA
jgi:hypothetical protein